MLFDLTRTRPPPSRAARRGSPERHSPARIASRACEAPLRVLLLRDRGEVAVLFLDLIEPAHDEHADDGAELHVQPRLALVDVMEVAVELLGCLWTDPSAHDDEVLRSVR